MIKLENEYLKVIIKKEGAEIISIKNKDGYEFIWSGDEKHWNRHAPVLFPIVGSLKDGYYTYNEKKYYMNQHGFARDNEFLIKEEQNDFVSLKFKYNQKSLEIYPFKFELEIEYKLIDNKVLVNYNVKNLDQIKMYYSIGGHPAFMTQKKEDYKLVVEDKCMIYPLKGNFISDPYLETVGMIKCDAKNFKDGAIILKPEKKRIIKLQHKNEDYITMEYEKFELIGIWTKESGDAPFICLEPWNGFADLADRSNHEIEKKDFINILNINEQKKQSYTIEFNKKEKI